MRHLLLAIVLGFLVSFTVSFKPDDEPKYGPWKTSICFKGVEYALAKKSYNASLGKTEWWVKFRNKYHETITFYYILKESYYVSAKTSERMQLKAGGIEVAAFYLDEANEPNVFVDNLKFGDSEAVARFAQCDR